MLVGIRDCAGLSGCLWRPRKPRIVERLGFIYFAFPARLSSQNSITAVYGTF